MKRTASLLTLTIFVLSLGLAACNTTQGVGEDIEAAGEAIEGAARDAKS